VIAWTAPAEAQAIAPTAAAARSSRNRNVKRWQNGNMALRWTAAGMLEAEQQSRRVIGADDLAKLAIAVEAHIARSRANDSPPRHIDAFRVGRCTCARLNAPSGRTLARFHGARASSQRRCCSARPQARLW